MKARQSSIYRKLENLLGALMAVSERVPKNAMGLQTAMSRCINEVVDAIKGRFDSVKLKKNFSVKHKLSIINNYE